MIDNVQVTQHRLALQNLTSATDRQLDAVAIPAEWYLGDTATIARMLIGCVLVRREQGQLLAGRIVETEAYLHDDPASHSWRGPTDRNRAMFSEGGCLYVYQIYGVHRCVNVVTGCAEVGTAVLLRAAEPLCGIDLMRARRNGVVRLEQLLSGPANLARGFGFELSDNFRPCTGAGVWILPPFEPPERIGVSPRIGITRNCDALLRFFDLDSAAVSAHRRAWCVEDITSTEF